MAKHRGIKELEFNLSEAWVLAALLSGGLAVIAGVICAVQTGKNFSLIMTTKRMSEAYQQRYAAAMELVMHYDRKDKLDQLAEQKAEEARFVESEIEALRAKQKSAIDALTRLKGKKREQAVSAVKFEFEPQIARLDTRRVATVQEMTTLQQRSREIRILIAGGGGQRPPSSVPAPGRAGTVVPPPGMGGKQ